MRRFSIFVSTFFLLMLEFLKKINENGKILKPQFSSTIIGKILFFTLGVTFEKFPLHKSWKNGCLSILFKLLKVSVSNHDASSQIGIRLH